MLFVEATMDYDLRFTKLASSSPEAVGERIRGLLQDNHRRQLRYANCPKPIFEFGHDLARRFRVYPSLPIESVLESSRFMGQNSFRVTVEGQVQLEIEVPRGHLFALGTGRQRNRMAWPAQQRLDSLWAGFLPWRRSRAASEAGYAVVPSSQGVLWLARKATRRFPWETAPTAAPFVGLPEINPDNRALLAAAALASEPLHPDSMQQEIAQLSCSQLASLLTGLGQLQQLDEGWHTVLRNFFFSIAWLNNQPALSQFQNLIEGDSLRDLDRPARLGILLSLLSNQQRDQVIKELACLLSRRELAAVASASLQIYRLPELLENTKGRVLAEFFNGIRARQLDAEMGPAGRHHLELARQAVSQETPTCARFIRLDWSEKAHLARFLRAARRPRQLARALASHQPQSCLTGEQKLATLRGALCPDLRIRLHETLALYGCHLLRPGSEVARYEVCRELVAGSGRLQAASPGNY